MKRSDKIFRTFLQDEIIKEKYEINLEEYPTVNKALESENPIVKAIALIITGLESDNMADKDIHTQVVNYLNRN